MKNEIGTQPVPQRMIAPARLPTSGPIGPLLISWSPPHLLQWGMNFFHLTAGAALFINIIELQYTVRWRRLT